MFSRTSPSASRSIASSTSSASLCFATIRFIDVTSKNSCWQVNRLRECISSETNCMKLHWNNNKILFKRLYYLMIIILIFNYWGNSPLFPVFDDEAQHGTVAHPFSKILNFFSVVAMLSYAFPADSVVIQTSFILNQRYILHHLIKIKLLWRHVTSWI